CARFPRRWY
ncbi:2-succinyl-5-enolpyruvyl-6-hydroxy-3-cyclohexene-1-carboxylic-acid synthase, partial [Escherichia coli FRIK1999]